MIFLDANIPMYLVGAPHPCKDRAKQALTTLIAKRRPMVTDAEVLQEILHRYAAIGRQEAIGPALDLICGLVREVYAVGGEDVLRARDILLAVAGLSARDALHIAVMERHDVEEILSFDRGFDPWPDIRRLES